MLHDKSGFDENHEFAYFIFLWIENFNQWPIRDFSLNLCLWDQPVKAESTAKIVFG